MPSDVLNGKSPKKVIIKRKVILDHLCVFGCLSCAKDLTIANKFVPKGTIYVSM